MNSGERELLEDLVGELSYCQMFVLRAEERGDVKRIERLLGRIGSVLRAEFNAESHAKCLCQTENDSCTL